VGNKSLKKKDLQSRYRSLDSFRGNAAREPILLVKERLEGENPPKVFSWGIPKRLLPPKRSLRKNNVIQKELLFSTETELVEALIARGERGMPRSKLTGSLNSTYSIGLSLEREGFVQGFFPSPGVAIDPFRFLLQKGPAHRDRDSSRKKGEGASKNIYS